MTQNRSKFSENSRRLVVKNLTTVNYRPTPIRDITIKSNKVWQRLLPGSLIIENHCRGCRTDGPQLVYPIPAVDRNEIPFSSVHVLDPTF